tara:strand:- start:6934 stop:8100 length:1167 start_codon:yes stop_codon:yes gene_type:complete
MNKINFFNILDFGNSKIRFSVFDLNFNERFSDSKNVNIDDNFENHFEEVNKIIKNAEKKFSHHIEDIILTLDTAKVFIINISLTKNLEKKEKINKLYETLLLDLKQIISSHYSKYYISQIIMDKCLVDHKKKFMEIPSDETTANNLKVDFKLICFPNELINKIRENFIKINLGIVNIFCSSYVKSQSYVKKLNKDKASFLDIGFRRSSLIFFENTKLKFIESIPIGSSHITKDISKIFKIPEEDAEKLKKFFNKTETEFSYDNKKSENSILFQDIIKKNISIDLLKKVILHRVQEIIDLIFKKSKINNLEHILEDTELFLIGEGSRLFNSNSFYLNDRFGFKSINYYSETDVQICNSSLENYVSNFELPEINNKKQGLFEKFFNFFDK